MKSRKLVALITSAVVTTVVMIPSVSSFADTTQGIPQKANKAIVQTNINNKATVENNQKQAVVNNKENNQRQTQQLKQQELNAIMTNTQETDGTVQKVVISTGKVIKTTKAEKENAIETFKKEKTAVNKVHSKDEGFSVTFNGYDHATCYNGDNIHQLKEQNSFASKTNETLYNYMLNPNNRWKTENEAINLHNGNGANDCAYFVSSALRAIGINIPTSTANCWTLQDNLSNLGWNKKSDLKGMQPGDVAFAGQDGDAHTYVFMGWANSAHTVAWVADSQCWWFGTNMHPRGLNSGLDISPTEFYFTAPGTPVTANINTSANANPDYKSYGVGVVNASVLNVRSEPNTNCSVIGEVYSGDVVQILAQNNNWDTINYNGKTAYVYAPFVNGSGPKHPNNITIKNPAPVVSKSLQYPSIGTGVVNQYTDAMQKSNWDCSVITTFDTGAKVTITGEANGWYRVNYQKESVWIPSNRIDSSIGSNVTAMKEQGIVDMQGNPFTYSKNIPSWNGSETYKLNNGTAVEVTGKADGWYRVVANGQTQWVPEGRIILGEVHSSIGRGVVSFPSCGYTDIMSSPTWYSNVIGQANDELVVKILQSKDGWYQIKTPNNKIGWVPNSRLITRLNNQYIGTGVVHQYTDVMSSNTWYSNVLGTASLYSQVNIVSEVNGWYEVAYNGNVGWIPCSRITTDLNQNKSVVKRGIVQFSKLSYTDIMNKSTWDSQLAGVLNNGIEVEIVGSANGWYEINYKNTTAWIPENRVAEGNISKVKFNLGYSDIMSQGTWYSTIQGALNNGTPVKIISTKDGWSQIVYGNNEIGWIPSNRLK
ncbi:MAG: SH3 domain-containing protein [Clostridium sp.]